MRLFDTLGSTADGVFAVDREQHIAFWNDAAERILGFAADTVLGRPCYEVFGATDARGCAVCTKRCATFRATLRDELPPTRDVQARCIGVRKWLSVTTLVLPSRYRDLSLLAHIFRESGAVPALRLPSDRPARVEPTSRGAPRGESLTPREREVLRLLAAGSSTRAICERLRIRETTVRTHVQHILAKLQVHSRLEAVAWASRHFRPSNAPR